MRNLPRKISVGIHNTLLGIMDTNQGQLRRVPNHVLAITVFLCFSVLLQGIADVVLKLLSYTAVLPILPWRTDFLFMTAVSVLIGYNTLMGMHRRRYDVTRNAIELGLLVEIGLIVGDVVFINQNIMDIPHVLPILLPFIVLTSINILILLYVHHVLNLRNWWR